MYESFWKIVIKEVNSNPTYINICASFVLKKTKREGGFVKVEGKKTKISWAIGVTGYVWQQYFEYGLAF